MPPRKTSLYKHSHPLNREIRLDIAEKLHRIRVKLYGDGAGNRVTAALAANLDPAQYYRYENGKVMPSFPMLINILVQWKLTWKDFSEQA